MSDQTLDEKTLPPPWPLHDHLVKLQSYKPEEVVGLTRMGAGLAFQEAPGQIAEITTMLADVRLDWPRLSPTRRNEITGSVERVINAVDGMLAMDSGHIDNSGSPANRPEEVASHRDQLIKTLTDQLRWFTEAVRPVSVMARTREQAEEIVRASSVAIDQTELNELKQTFAELREEAAAFERMRPVVEAQRELLGESGTAKLSSDFEDESHKHAKAWKKWLAALLLWVVASGVGGAYFIYASRPPDDATNAQIASHLFLDLLVIGLALFIVRIFSLQFRAHRHMEVVTRNKANALSTFNRLVTGQEQDVKAVVAAALAQAVFTSDEGIFSDAASEQVTIVERILSPGIDRLRG